MNPMKQPSTWIIIVSVILCAIVIVRAQQPAPPKSITLNSEASKVIDQIETSKAECVKEAAKQEALILTGAGVPKDFQCNRTEGGWTCSPPAKKSSAGKEPE